jgi:hypothetical protein
MYEWDGEEWKEEDNEMKRKKSMHNNKIWLLDYWMYE